MLDNYVQVGRALHNKNGDGVRFCCHSIVKRRLLFMLSGGGCVRELSQVMSHFQGPHVCLVLSLSIDVRLLFPNPDH